MSVTFFVICVPGGNNPFSVNDCGSFPARRFARQNSASARLAPLSFRHGMPIYRKCSLPRRRTTAPLPTRSVQLGFKRRSRSSCSIADALRELRSARQLLRGRGARTDTKKSRVSCGFASHRERASNSRCSMPFPWQQTRARRCFARWPATTAPWPEFGVPSVTAALSSLDRAGNTALLGWSLFPVRVS